MPTVYQSVPIVHLVDDDPAIRQSTGQLIESAGLALQSFDSAEAFLGHVTPDAAGCLILDHSMPGMTGLELVARMRELGFLLPVLMVSGVGTIEVAVEGMKLGLFDYLVKPADPDVLLAKVRAALELDAQRRAASAQLDDIRAKLATLTAREQELLELIVRGLPNKNIATELGISIKTVENHRGSLMAKTGAANVADLVRMKMLVTDTGATPTPGATHRPPAPPEPKPAGSPPDRDH